MELGNIVFGNSRGEVALPHGRGWEEELFRLFDAYAPGRDNPYGEPFENAVFTVMPYWWGDCTCGWDMLDGGHQAVDRLGHAEGCYRHDYDRLRSSCGVLPPRDEIKRLYEQRGWPTDGDDWWFGCAVRCSCDYNERYGVVMQEYALEFGHEGHRPDCKEVMPNFHYKPTDYQIQWYKYPLRDSYANREITLQEFLEIIDKCIDSL